MCGLRSYCHSRCRHHHQMLVDQVALNVLCEHVGKLVISPNFDHSYILVLNPLPNIMKAHFQVF